jgi:hypothetical protein
MRILGLSAITALTLVAGAADAQTAANLDALKGLTPFSVLLNSAAGKAALASNLRVTGDIQNGISRLPALQAFAQQQARALKDAQITGSDGYQLADGLGSKLGGAYQSLTSCSKSTGMMPDCTNISPAIANLIGYAFTLTGSDANSGKYFFANETAVNKDGAKPVSAAAAAIMKAAGGATDVYGRAYGKPAGSAGADPAGNSRPFQTEARVTEYADPDFFGDPSNNQDYLTGPAQKLTASPAFPSGHTTYGTTESLLFAIMVPERFTQMVTRGAEYGNERIIIGAHYAMDVIGGRTLAYYDIAQMLSNKPDYVGQKAKKFASIGDFPAALKSAKAELRSGLEKACGSISACAADDRSRFNNPAANAAFYRATLTYGLPVVYPSMAGRTENIEIVAPEAGTLLQAAFPRLSLAEADHILTVTEGPGGGFLDDGSGFGVYSRLDLVDAGRQAAGYK